MSSPQSSGTALPLGTGAAYTCLRVYTFSPRYLTLKPGNRTNALVATNVFPTNYGGAARWAIAWRRYLILSGPWRGSMNVPRIMHGSGGGGAKAKGKAYSRVWQGNVGGGGGGERFERE